VQPLAIDHRLIRGFEDLCGQPGAPQEFLLDRGGLADPDALRADARLGDEPQEVGKVALLVRSGGCEYLIQLIPCGW